MLRREETGGGGVGGREERREGGREGEREGQEGSLGREGRNGHWKRIMRKRESKAIRI